MNTLIDQFHLNTSGRLGFLLLSILLAILFTLFIYRRTNPIVSGITRSLLVFFRVAALVFLLFVIFETSLSFAYKRNQPPLLAVAVDNSASMTISDNDGNRAHVVDSLMRTDLFSELNKTFTMKYYTISNQLESFDISSDSMRFLGDKSNLQSGLQQIKAENRMENLNSILLISDGSYNAGGNPVRSAEQLGVPIHSIGVGSPQPITDIALTDVKSNPFTYAGETTPISITLRNSGYDKLTFPSELTSQGSVVARETVQLPPSPSDVTVTLNYSATDVGRQKLLVNIPIQQNEYSKQNNQKTFYIDVFKSKLNILMISGSVTPDVAFFKRHLSTDRYSITSLVQKSANTFYEPLPTDDTLSDTDIFIFYDFPRAQHNPQFLQRLSETIASRNQAFFYILGRNSSLTVTQQWFNIVPVRRAALLNSPILVSPEIPPVGISHPILQLAETLTQTQSLWSRVPPLFASFYIQELQPGTEVIAYGRRQNAAASEVMPLLALHSKGGQKSAAFFAHDLWRWDLMMRGFDRDADVLNHLLINTIRWLETDRSDNLVRVDMEKTNYNFGEPVEVSVDVFDDNLNAVDDAQVDITIKAQPPQTVIATPNGDGNYSATMQPSQPGDYAMNVTATWQGRTLGSEDALFSVGEYSAELSDLQAQHVVLKALAQTTGGTFVPADSAALLLTNINGTPRTITATVDQALWNNKFILFFILLFLTLEWFLRKRKGML